MRTVTWVRFKASSLAARPFPSFWEAFQRGPALQQARDVACDLDWHAAGFQCWAVSANMKQHARRPIWNNAKKKNN